MDNCYFFLGDGGVVYVEDADHKDHASPNCITIFHPVIASDLFGNIKYIRDGDSKKVYHPAPDGRRLRK